MLSLPILLATVALCGRRILAADIANCTTSVAAKSGDSCGSLANQYGIDIDKFKDLNPGLISCVLIAGTSYCVSDVPGGAKLPTATTPAFPRKSSPTASATSSARASASPTGTLVPSPDGSEGVCGGNYTCLGSVYGECCSLNGYCGSTTDYCGEGCNPAFGRCGGGLPAECDPNALVTTTIIQAPGACTATLISVSTKTVTVNSPKTVTITATVTTSVPKTITATATRTTTVTGSARPSPTLPGTNRNCASYYRLRATDSCQRIARENGVSVFQLTNWNPNLDCDDPEDSAGYYICVGV